MFCIPKIELKFHGFNRFANHFRTKNQMYTFLARMIKQVFQMSVLKNKAYVFHANERHKNEIVH